MHLTHQTFDANAVHPAVLARSSRWQPKIKDARSYLERAYSHFFQGDYDQAEGDWRSATRFNSTDQDVIDELVRLARLLGVLRLHA